MVEKMPSTAAKTHVGCKNPGDWNTKTRHSHGGFYFDYVFDWTILKYQQLQIANVPPRNLGLVAAKSSGMAPVFATGDRQLGGEVGRGWFSNDPSRRRISGPVVNAGSLSKQKNPIANEASESKDAMMNEEQAPESPKALNTKRSYGMVERVLQSALNTQLNANRLGLTKLTSDSPIR